MAIELWPPFEAFTTLEQEMHSLLDRIGARPWLEGFGWKPDTDIWRDGATLVVETELPGIDPEADLSVELRDGVLQIHGHRESTSQSREADRYVSERRAGAFTRNVMIPAGIDGNKVSAQFKNGVLTLRIPLPSDATDKARQSHSVDVELLD